MRIPPIISAALIALVISCGRNEVASRTSVFVVDSTLAVGDTFHASIHVLDTAARFQQFFVIEDEDTFRLPVTRNWKVGLLEVLCQQKGTRTINGFSRIEHSDSTIFFIEPFHLTFNVE